MQRDHSLDFTSPKDGTVWAPRLSRLALEELERDRNAERGPSKATCTPRPPLFSTLRQQPSSRGLADESHRSGHQGSARDHEAERDQPSRDRKRAAPDRLAEHEDAAHDRREVGRDRRERDHLDARPEL
jgi:hypothetical protein